MAQTESRIDDEPRPDGVELTDVEQRSENQPGAHWSTKEVQEIPYNNMKIVMPAPTLRSLMLTAFLGALDQTIAAVSLPRIVEDIGGESGYSWVGSAYMLMSACFNPLYGRLADITGRKPILFGSIATFLLGSALAGSAQSFIWLALCRGVQGIGAGGSLQVIMITLSDITTLQERSKYGGGILTDHASWRWCFWINLPLGGISMVSLFFFLHLKPLSKRTVRDIVSTFDFLGLFLLTAGVILFLFGLEDANTAADGWRAPETLAPLIIGIVLLTAGVVNGVLTKRNPIIPPRLFKTRTTAACCIGTFIHTFVFFGASYYTPLYFQVLGSSATMAGIRQMPLSIGGAVTSIVIGIVLSKTGLYRPILWAGSAIMTLGTGLLIMLDENTSTAKQELWLLVVGIGVGFLFQAPLIVVQAAMPLKDMPTSTATVGLLRTLGGTVGISVGNTIFQSELSKRLAKIGGLSSSLGSGLLDYTTIQQIQPDSLRQQVSHAFTRSIATIFIVWTPMSSVALLLFLVVKNYSLERNFERAPKQEKDSTSLPASVQAGIH
ncbi:hypothetical protein ACEPAF_7619 [Sanghuangporus sanghuang]